MISRLGICFLLIKRIALCQTAKQRHTPSQYAVNMKTKHFTLIAHTLAEQNDSLIKKPPLLY